MNKLKTLLVLSVFAAAASLLLTSVSKTRPVFHSEAELKSLRSSRSPIDSDQYFLGSIRCRGCHGYDSTIVPPVASVDAGLHDVNLFDDWQSTMMAMSAKDPLWRAKVSHEILIDPGHSLELQTKCTSCHAPMGHFTAMFKGATSYTIADLLQDTLGLNGVACSGCHEIGSDSILPIYYSGDIRYDTTRKEFGPFANPVIGPMQLYVGLIPTFSTHMERSQVCASCHTLITKTADLSGTYTGGTFTEQATYHEWLNSAFNASQPCQSCHMPQIKDPIVLAAGYTGLPHRSPFNLHQFAGANYTMLNLIKNNKSSLGVDVADAYFDSTLALTMVKLQQESIDMSMNVDSTGNDTLYLSVSLRNKTGHKFPSGYPSRRAYLNVVVNSGTDTIFHSGNLRPDFEVDGQDPFFEHHYDVISDSTQVQIYEIVPGDVAGDFTTLLERAAVILKDNRIPPQGFTTSHYTYDTVQIAGEALADPDFNRNGITEGTGKDIVHYHIPLKHFTGSLHIGSKFYYQTLPPRYVTPFDTLSSAAIDTFKSMFALANKKPILVASHDTTNVLIVSGIANITNAPSIHILPNPTLDGQLTIQGNRISRIEIWDISGRKCNDIPFHNFTESANIALPDAKGIYLLKIYAAGGITVKKVVRE